MKKGLLFLTLLLLFPMEVIGSDNGDNFTQEESQVLDQARQNGASEEEIKMIRLNFKAKREKDKAWSEEELRELEDLLLSKWSEMRGALARGDIDTAVGFFAEKSRDTYRKIFSSKTREQLVVASEALSDIQFLRAQGRRTAECDIRRMKDGEIYSFPVRFEKNSDDVWEIVSF